MPREVKQATYDLGSALGVLAVSCWAWAFALLAVRGQGTLQYFVLHDTPFAWGFIVWHPVCLLVLVLVAIWLGRGLVKQSKQSAAKTPRSTYWLLSTFLIPLLDVLRLTGVNVEATFAEPLGFVFVTGMASFDLARQAEVPNWLERVRDRGWLCITSACALAAGAWWYLQGVASYDDLLLGYHDFGHFGRRVINTWEGRGFLMESPSLPAFWDHFNPSLALLAPLWGLWPDPKLFLAIQAFCLAAPAPLVYLLSRQLGSKSTFASLWALSYLLFPALGQLNLNGTYGWHPVSLVLPLLFLFLYLLLTRRLLAAVFVAALALGFKESVFVTLGCLAFAMGCACWLNARAAREADSDSNDAPPESNDRSVRLPAALTPATWFAVWLVLLISFILVYKLAPFSEFQTDRFGELGDSALAIITSPITNPTVFWGQVLSIQSLYFLLALFVPILVALRKQSWPFLVTVSLPLLLLLAWPLLHTTSISFQYTTSLIPFLLLAAITGSSAERERNACLATFACCLTASFLWGAMPWSCRTQTIMESQSYVAADGSYQRGMRAKGTRGNDVVMETVQAANHSKSSVLATGRIASHFLNAGRLEPVDQAFFLRTALADEAGEGRTAVQLFDWVILDFREIFQQSPTEHSTYFALEARTAGYIVVHDVDGILILKRPD